jgi:hypothetical protein
VANLVGRRERFDTVMEKVYLVNWVSKYILEATEVPETKNELDLLDYRLRDLSDAVDFALEAFNKLLELYEEDDSDVAGRVIASRGLRWQDAPRRGHASGRRARPGQTRNS